MLEAKLETFLPSGEITSEQMHDDGLHGDGVANDGGLFRHCLLGLSYDRPSVSLALLFCCYLCLNLHLDLGLRSLFVLAHALPLSCPSLPVWGATFKALTPGAYVLQATLLGKDAHGAIFRTSEHYVRVLDNMLELNGQALYGHPPPCDVLCCSFCCMVSC